MFRRMRGFVLVHRVHIAVARRRSDGDHDVVVVNDIRDREVFDGLGGGIRVGGFLESNRSSCTIIFDARSIS